MYKDMETGLDDDGALQEKLCALQLLKALVIILILTCKTGMTGFL